MTSIYKLNQDLHQLLNLDIDDQAVKDTIESLSIDHNEKCESVMFYVKELDDQVAQIKAEKARLDDMAKKLTKRAADLKNMVIQNMESREVTKLDGLLTISYVKPKPMLEVTDEGLVSDIWIKRKVTESLDKTGMLKALKDGEEVEGAKIGYSKAGLKY